MLRNTLTYSFLLAFSFLITGGCTKTRPEMVEIPDYIQFGADSYTKVNRLIEDMAGHDFGVFAFRYNSDWNTYKSTGKPVSTSEFKAPTKVAYDEASRSWKYDGINDQSIQPWIAGNRYSFFAYHPFGWNKITPSDERNIGSPVITYTVPYEAGKETNTDDLRDVMRSSSKDLTSSTGVVNFHFTHCLSCLTVEAHNYDKVTDSSDESKDKSISDLKIYFTSKMYTTLTIPLDEDLTPTPGEISKDGDIFIFNIVGESTTINVPAMVVPEGGKGSLETVDISRDNNILIIPQRPEGPDGLMETTSDNMGPLTGYISFTGKDGFKTGNPNVADSEESLRFTSSKYFEAGKKLALVINFTDDSVNISIIEPGDWTDKNQEITFE